MTEHIKIAMKAKDAQRLNTLRQIKAEILKKETEKGAADLDEAGLIRMLQTMRKQRQEAIALYEKGDRADLAAKERVEIEVIDTFLPKPLSDEELAAMVAERATALGIQDMKGMGQLIKATLDQAAGRADGKRVSTAVRTHLAS
jgi:hypothetical protein